MTLLLTVHKLCDLLFADTPKSRTLPQDIASWLTDVQSSANETEKEQSDGQLISDGKQNGSKPFKEWKHPRQELLSGCCQYSVRYLGSTLVRELRGIDSTRASMGKLKSAHASVPPMQIPKIILSISCQGVQFRDFKSNVSFVFGFFR